MRAARVRLISGAVSRWIWTSSDASRDRCNASHGWCARRSERCRSASPPMSFADDLDAQRAQVMRAVRQAGAEWAEAMRAHKLAPPDPGFAGRLRALAGAAEREQVAWEHAHAAGLLWRPIPGAE